MREGGGNGCLLCGMKMMTMSLTSWLPMCHVILLTHWVVHGSGALGVAAVVIHGCCSEFNRHWGHCSCFRLCGQSQSFVRQLFVVHWLLFSGCCLLCMQLSKWQAVVWAPGLFVVVWVV